MPQQPYRVIQWTTGAVGQVGIRHFAAINAIPDVCDAPPGWLSHHHLGLIRPRGLVR